MSRHADGHALCTSVSGGEECLQEVDGHHLLEMSCLRFRIELRTTGPEQYTPQKCWLSRAQASLFYIKTRRSHEVFIVASFRHFNTWLGEGVTGYDATV